MISFCKVIKSLFTFMKSTKMHQNAQKAYFTSFQVFSGSLLRTVTRLDVQYKNRLFLSKIKYIKEWESMVFLRYITVSGLTSGLSLDSQTELAFPSAPRPAPRSSWECRVVCFQQNNEWHGWWAHTETQQRAPSCPATLTVVKNKLSLTLLLQTHPVSFFPLSFISFRHLCLTFLVFCFSDLISVVSFLF